MSVSRYKIKKWIDMLRGRSVHHVNQNEGEMYSKHEVLGYYNNLTEKVSKFGLPGNEIPKSHVDSGEVIYFAIEIFQYGLGAYDLFLINKDTSMLEKMLSCADWAVDNITEDGGWKAFAHKTPEFPYSSMAQGEGISLLIRAYKETKEQKYLDASHKAVQFLLKSVDEGGTAWYDGEDIYLKEYVNEPLVLNGWIFSLWGLLDYYLWVRDLRVKDIYDKTVHSLVRSLPKYDINYWSKYDNSKRICSPFYHKLHIAQLNVMYDLTGEEEFIKYSRKWQKNIKSRICYSRAFIVKAIQKIME